jgi:hypothetical protein
VFAPDLYKAILDNLPRQGEWRPHGAANRDYLPLEKAKELPGEKGGFWKEVNSWLCAPSTVEACLEKFGIQKKCRLSASLVRQRVGYSLGPHTDSPNKVLTLLFYLPSAEDDVSSGTVIYRPKDGRRCDGNKHHEFKDFETVKAMPFLPNSVFAFEKSNLSFHGVETVKKVRDVLQYNINA